MSDVQFTVTEDEAGSRLDVLLVRRTSVFSRKTAMAAILNGDVRVNGRRVKKSYVVEAGNEVVVANVPLERVFHAVADPAVTLDVLFENEDLVVLNKPARMPTHPLDAQEIGTLANGLVARYPEMRDVGYDTRQPGILHRLDNDTSGVVLSARNAASFSFLREQLTHGDMEKSYVALVEGRVSAGRTIEFPLMPHPRDKKRVHACMSEADENAAGSRSAQTYIDRVETVAGMSLVRVSAPTARRHQIRVHLSAIGHPLVGDLLYGGPAFHELSRHFLHASSLTFDLSRGGSRRTVVAPLPEELMRVTSAIGFEDAVVREFVRENES